MWVRKIAPLDSTTVVLIKPVLIMEEDITPNSVWEKWLAWMREEFQNNVNSDILTPANMLNVSVVD